jgi:hypothetical protein
MLPRYSVTIVVNARKVEVEKDKLTYREVVILAFESYDENSNITYTVEYTNNKHDEPKSLVDGGKSVEPKEGMMFFVTPTDKS